MMFDAKGILDKLVGSGAAGGFAGGLAGGALANMLAGKKGRKLAGSALKLGGVALVGGLAYKAWQSYKQGGVANPNDLGVSAPPADGAFIPKLDDTAGANALSLLLARAMITAAKADGQIDTQESQSILDQINGLELSAADKAFLFEEYSRPLDVQALVREVSSPEQAAEVYAASVLMLEPPSAVEKVYLDMLASALGLEQGLVEQVNATVQANRV